MCKTIELNAFLWWKSIPFLCTYVIHLSYLYFLWPATIVQGAFGLILVSVSLVTHSCEQENSKELNIVVAAWVL